MVARLPRGNAKGPLSLGGPSRIGVQRFVINDDSKIDGCLRGGGGGTAAVECILVNDRDDVSGGNLEHAVWRGTSRGQGDASLKTARSSLGRQGQGLGRGFARAVDLRRCGRLPGEVRIVKINRNRFPEMIDRFACLNRSL